MTTSLGSILLARRHWSVSHAQYAIASRQLTLSALPASARSNGDIQPRCTMARIQRCTCLRFFSLRAAQSGFGSASPVSHSACPASSAPHRSPGTGSPCAGGSSQGHRASARFASKTLLRWYRAGENAERRLPILSAYLGHVHWSDTFWYLSALPELMHEAMSRLERRWGGSAMTAILSLAPLLERFFTQRLIQQRQVSPHTISSYRDTFRQFLKFTRQRLHKPPSALGFEEIDAPLVVAFLDHIGRSCAGHR